MNNPTLTIAFDRRTANTVEAFSEDGGRPLEVDGLHPLLRQRARSLGAVADSEFLGHAELKAVNELLHARGIDLDEAALSELVLRTIDPWANPDVAVPPCDSCRIVLSGVTHASP